MTGQLTRFLDIVAWAVLVYNAVATMLTMYGAITYSDLQETLDSLRGVRRRYPWHRHLAYALIAGAWLYAGRGTP